MDEKNDWRVAENRANWDDRRQCTWPSPFYEVERLVADRSYVSPVARRDFEVLRPHLGPDGLEGRSVLHLQCHIGTDTLCWERLGAAEVWGLDFSPASLEQAREITARAGAQVTYVEGDARHAAVDRVFSSTSWSPAPARSVAAGARGLGRHRRLGCSRPGASSWSATTTRCWGRCSTSLLRCTPTTSPDSATTTKTTAATCPGRPAPSSTRARTTGTTTSRRCSWAACWLPALRSRTSARVRLPSGSRSPAWSRRQTAGPCPQRAAHPAHVCRGCAAPGEAARPSRQRVLLGTSRRVRVFCQNSPLRRAFFANYSYSAPSLGTSGASSPARRRSSVTRWSLPSTDTTASPSIGASM